MNRRSSEVARLRGLLEGQGIAMLATATGDDSLVSRPMALRDVDGEGCLWFVTRDDSGKTREARLDHHVNASFALPGREEYLSVAGLATVLYDPARTAELWSPALQVYFPNGPSDPALCLLRVEPRSAEYWKGPDGLVGQALYFVAAAATGDPHVLSENTRIDLRH